MRGGRREKAEGDLTREEKRRMKERDKP